VDDELRSKIEEVVEEKVEESLEQGTDSDISRIVEQKVEEKLEDQEQTAKRGLDLVEDGDMNRRSFLKMLGLGGAGLGLASSGAAANLLSGTKIGGNTVFHQGNDYGGAGSSTTALDADTVDGKEASQLGGSVNSAKNFTGNKNLRLYNGSLYVGNPATTRTYQYNNSSQYTVSLSETPLISTVRVRGNCTSYQNRKCKAFLRFNYGNTNYRFSFKTNYSFSYTQTGYLNTEIDSFTIDGRGGTSVRLYLTMSRARTGTYITLT
jgi:hypothetical protein